MTPKSSTLSRTPEMMVGTGYNGVPPAPWLLMWSWWPTTLPSRQSLIFKCIIVTTGRVSPANDSLLAGLKLSSTGPGYDLAGGLGSPWPWGAWGSPHLGVLLLHELAHLGTWSGLLMAETLTEVVVWRLKEIMFLLGFLRKILKLEIPNGAIALSSPSSFFFSPLKKQLFFEA